MNNVTVESPQQPLQQWYRTRVFGVLVAVTGVFLVAALSFGAGFGLGRGTSERSLRGPMTMSEEGRRPDAGRMPGMRDGQGDARRLPPRTPGGVPQAPDGQTTPQQ